MSSVRHRSGHPSIARIFAAMGALVWASVMPLPGQPPRVAQPPAEWKTSALEQLIDWVAEQRTTGLVVLHRGQLAVERYWPADPSSRRHQNTVAQTLDDGRTLEDVASVQKSVVALLVSRAIHDGRVQLDDRVSSHLGAGWSKSPPEDEASITLHHLLSMTSGLTPQLRSETPAGTTWRYNTRAYSVLLRVLERATDSDIHQLTAEWLTGPLQMSESSWQPRPWVGNQDAHQLGFVSSAADLAQLGELVRRGGHSNGRQLLDPELLASVLRPSQEFNPAYGQLWWLNGYPAQRPNGDQGDSLIPEAPSDLVAALGALGRKVYVVPSLELVATRVGDLPPAGADFDRQFWRRMMAALPQSAPCSPCERPLAARPPAARSADGQTIRWREHIIDDPTRGVGDLSGSDGLQLGDLDGDGFDDVVSVHESDTVYDGQPIGHVRIAWGSADPHVWHTTTLASGPEAAAAEDVSLADADGDGDLDVLVACELAHLLYLDNPGGPAARKTRWQRVVPAITRGRGSWIRAYFADFDGDGRPEVAAANKGEQNPGNQADPPQLPISVFQLPGAPLDGDRWKETVLGRVQVPINAVPVDLDGDGDLDVLGGSRRERRLLWFENQTRAGGELEFREREITPEDAPKDLSITGFNVDFADLDGDGRLDIVSTAWPGALVLLRQPPAPASNTVWSFSRIGDAPPDQLVSVRLADLDGDGDLDAFSGAYSRGPRDRDGPLIGTADPIGRIAWFENPGGNGTSSPTTRWKRHDISRRKRGMYDQWWLRDLDGDGDLDVLGTRGNSEPYDGVFWLEQVREPPAPPSKRPVFEAARRIDSQQMGPSSPN